MESSDQMPSLTNADKLTPIQRSYMKIVEQQARERGLKMATMRRKNIWLACSLGVGVLAIYGYSMFAVKQERFLDELDD